MLPQPSKQMSGYLSCCRVMAASDSMDVILDDSKF